MERDLTCRELVELVTDYLEAALPAAERARFEAHVAACPGCERYIEHIRTAIDLTAATADLQARPETSALLEMFRGYRRP